MARDGRLRWAVDISRWSPEPNELEHLLGLLPGAEQEACRKFRFLDDQKRALVSRLLQRASAAAVLGLPFCEVVIQRTRGSKPYIAGAGDRSAAPNFNYSVSHEGDFVVLASEGLCVCGCDVAAPNQVRRRQQEPLASFFKCFVDQFTAAEWASINALSPDEDAMQAQFRRLWSLKEAYVKATGEGLGFDLGKAEFKLSGCTATVKVDGKAQPRWAFFVQELGRGHYVSVARGPLEAVVDAWGGFKGTFQQNPVPEQQLLGALAAPEPPFTLLTVGDLLPVELRPAYAAAGGDVW
ncbi:hypothetical protein N2152v2_007223 [Parachlorella kessleri]